jgi:hypothetical protein
MTGFLGCHKNKGHAVHAVPLVATAVAAVAEDGRLVLSAMLTGVGAQQTTASGWCLF